MDVEGWISLHRKIQDCFIWDVKPFSWGQAWIDLLLIANHNDARTAFDGKMITVGMGQRITSIRYLADRWGWSRTKVTNFLNVLEEEEMIIRKSDTKKTLLTIVNYEQYQNITKEKSHQKDTEKTQKSTNNNKYIYGDFSEADFETLWKMYPRKKGKGQISDTQKKKIAKIGFERMKTAIERFIAEMDGQDMQYIPYGSTFFNSGYVDYLPEEVSKPPKPVDEPKEDDPYADCTEEDIDNMDSEEFAKYIEWTRKHPDV